VELLAERHDVDAVLAERRTDGGRRVRLSRGELQLHVAGDLLHRSFLCGPGGLPHRTEAGFEARNASRCGRARGGEDTKSRLRKAFAEGGRERGAYLSS